MFAHKSSLISTGNETFDRFLGGGFLKSSLNIFERKGPSSALLDPIVNKSISASTLKNDGILVFLNFNTSVIIDKPKLISSLPICRKVKSEYMYRDIRGSDTAAKIKIAWRYTNLSSPSDDATNMTQIDFGASMKSLDLSPTIEDSVHIHNVAPNDDQSTIFDLLMKILATVKRGQTINFILKDLIHPFSPFFGDSKLLLNFMYSLRCFARKIVDGCITVSYDSILLDNYEILSQRIYGLVDSVVSFYSYETDENEITGYKYIDGTLCYLKPPKINSLGFHVQQDLSDWGYRVTNNRRFFVVDELSLPPSEEETKKVTLNAHQSP